MTPEQLDELEKLAEAQELLRAGSYALPLLKALREARVELGEALDELAFIKEEYGNGDPAEMTEDALLLKLKTITLDYNKARAEVERLRAERDEARKWLEGICTEFESTIAHAEWRVTGSKGMSVPFTGDFADAARHPGMLGRMGWWVRQFRAALKAGDR